MGTPHHMMFGSPTWAVGFPVKKLMVVIVEPLHRQYHEGVLSVWKQRRKIPSLSVGGFRDWH